MRLKDIFDLMFNKLQSISIDNRFIQDIEVRRKKVFNKDLPDSFFYEWLVVSIHVQGFKAKYLKRYMPAIKKAFSDFDINKVSSYASSDLVDLQNNREIINHTEKLKACIDAAKVMKSISDKYGSFGKFLDENKKDLGRLKELLLDKFADCRIRELSARNFMRDIGFDEIKPDVHILRIFGRLGLINPNQDSASQIRSATKIAEQMKEETGEKFDVIDGVFWIYGSGGEHDAGEGCVKKAICTKNNPLCNECPLTDQCSYYKQQVLTDSL